VTGTGPGGDARETAHDINNLLTAIIGAADAVLERPETGPETRADAAHIREGARRGAALVQRLLHGADHIAAPARLISINETIRATSRLLEHRLGAGVRLTLRLTESDGQVRADPSEVDRILMNLIVNAGHATPSGGTVTLSTARSVLTTALPRVPDTIAPGDYMTITIADTGTGIPSSDLDRIFEPGFSTRRVEGGSGLGLASVRDIVRAAGGLLAVTSVEGQGTRFEIYLPREEGPAPRSPCAFPGTAVGTALLVEDDILVRRVAERMLRRAGWTVICADSGEAAQEILLKTQCDLMISDVVLPGMDGVALARLVLASRPDMPIILTSGYEPAATEEADLPTNFVFLTKPYGQEDLLAAVARIGEGRTFGSPPEA
jgi:two-component system cell cycle sensor histidine kinase/response regulator CckA